MRYGDDDDGDDDDDNDIDITMHYSTGNDYDNDDDKLCTVWYDCDCDAHGSCLYWLISVPIKDSCHAYSVTHELTEI